MKRVRILIVEDEVIVAEDLEVAINNIGYKMVGYAVTAKDAIEKAVELKPDLILMDIILGGKADGIDASVEIKEKLGIPIVFLTSYSDIKLMDRAKVTEPYAYILKPFQERQLFASIEMALYKNQIERRLKESEERHRNLIALAPDGILTLDMQGVIRSCNIAVLDLTGYAKNEIVGKHFLKLGFLKVRDLPKYIKLFDSMVRGKAFKPFEINWHSKDGILHCSEIHVGMIEENGKTVGFQVIARDITERKRAEEARRKSEEHFMKIIENIFKFVPDGLLVLTDKLNLFRKNKAFQDIVKKYSAKLNYTEQELMEIIIGQVKNKIINEDHTEIRISKKQE